MAGAPQGCLHRQLTELLAAAREFGIATLPVQHTAGREVRLGPRGERLESDGEFAPETYQLVAEIDRMAEQVPLAAPWEAPEAGRLDGISFAAWLDKHAPEVAIRELTQPIRGYMGDLAGFSLLHLLFYSRSNGGVGTFAGVGKRHDSLEFGREEGELSQPRGRRIRWTNLPPLSRATSGQPGRTQRSVTGSPPTVLDPCWIWSLEGPSSQGQRYG